ncbi:MAG TPA: FtsX-like permease family protein, partial [Streptosporangiaceae bacterium]|nr:FtsX-like permease family protein [Streptosporangiaceae bacterium]
MRSSRLLLGCILLTTMITAALITALTSFWVQALVQAADDQLRHSNAMSMVISGQVNAPTATADDGVIRAAVHGAFGPVPYRLDGAVWSNPLGFGVPSHSGTRPPTAPGRVVKLIEAAALGQVTANAVLVAGAWPDPPGNGGPIPAALPAAAASRLHAGPGTVFTLYDRDTGRRVRIRVTGLFRPRNPRALYWGLDSLGTSAVSVTPPFVTYGPLAVSPGAFGHGGLAVGQASWVALPDAAHIGGDITGLAARLSNAEAFFRNTASLGGLQVSSGVPQALTATGLNLGVARSLLTIGGLQFLLLAAAALTLPARLLASHRDEESALLSARGARRWQLVSPGLAEALLLAGTAVIAGALAGSRLAGLLVDTHSLQAAGLRVTGTPAALWWAALAVLVLCTVIMLGTALKPAPPGEVRIRRGRQAAVAAAARAGGDLSLLALAVVAILELRTYSPVAHPAAGGIGIDPVAVIAPALALAGATLIPLRALPALAKVADRLAGRTRRLGAALASWEISRRPVRQSGPLLLVVLAVATGTLALTQRASWQQSAQDQAAYAVGSDVSVTTQKPATLSTAGAVAGAPGVRAATPVTQVSLDSGGEVIALDARAAAAAVSLRPDLSPLPPRALWGRITPSEPHTGLALPGHPERLGLTVTLTSREGTAAPWPVVATVQDAHGIDYTLGAGALTADGHTHQLITDLAGTRGAAYPLRLLGVSLTYPLPTFAASQHVQPAASGTATLTVVSLAAAYSANGPFSPPFAQGDALAS